MRTSEILEYIAQDLLDDRSKMVEGEPDHIWSSRVLIRYYNEGARRLCRDAWVLQDSETPCATVIDLKENVTTYKLHPSVIFVKAARLSDSDVDLHRVGYDDNRIRPAILVADADFFDVNHTITEQAGRPIRFSTDLGLRSIRVGRKPDADAAALKLLLTVVRLPIIELSEKNLDLEPEIPAEYQMDVAQYAAGKALQNANIDAAVKRQGRDWVVEFETKLVREAGRDRRRTQQSQPQFRFGGWASDGNG